MNALLVASAIAVGAGDLLLVLACWRSRTILGGLLGLIGLALAVWAIVARPMSSYGRLALGGALVALVLGSCLFVVGKVVTRLLEEHEDPAGPG